MLIVTTISFLITTKGLTILIWERMLPAESLGILPGMIVKVRSTHGHGPSYRCHALHWLRCLQFCLQGAEQAAGKGRRRVDGLYLDHGPAEGRPQCAPLVHALRGSDLCLGVSRGCPHQVAR